ncbi:hypothetical protein [uncultured Dysosmobacter sp.]|uniref:hypothetical protein n=1 Tax=uncultured Dysosmobacter sp. TaxID=2591384 RepID=UPI0034A0CC58
MITKYKDKHGPRGDLARDMADDSDIRKLCQETNERDRIQEYLHKCGACSACISVFDLCFRDYCKEELVNEK